MKKILRIIGYVFVILYLLFVVLLNVLVLSKNRYGFIENKDKTYVVIDSKNKSDNYSIGDLIEVKKVSISDISVNNKLFIYKSDSNNNVYIKEFVVNKINKNNDKEYYLELKDDSGIYSQDLIVGKYNKKFSHIGKIIDTLTKKNIFLVVVLVPCILLFIIIIKNIISGFKERDEE